MFAMRYVIFLLIAALIAYGSLYPFSFSSDAQSWRSMFADFRLYTSRGDVLGNFLLFVPFGIAGMVAFQQRFQMTASACAVFVAGLAFAAILQGAQLYLPAREAALSDALWNMLGLTAGMIVAPAATRVLHLQQSLQVTPLVLLALWFAQELVPFVPTLDLQKIKDSIKPLVLDPVFIPVNVVYHGVAALLAGRILSGIAGERESRFWLCVCVVIVLAGKLIVVSRALSVSLVIGLACACAIWIWIAKHPRRDTLLMLALLLALTVTALHPFSARWPPAQFNWIPFAGQLEGAMLLNLTALLEKLFLYAGILWLTSGRSIWPAAIFLALFVLLLEAAQMLIVGRSADITEAIWVFMTAAALLAIGNVRRA